MQQWVTSLGEIEYLAGSAFDKEIFEVVRHYWIVSVYSIAQTSLYRELAEQGMLHPVDEGNLEKHLEKGGSDPRAMWDALHLTPSKGGWKWIPRYFRSLNSPIKRWPLAIAKKKGLAIASGVTSTLECYLKAKNARAVVWDSDWFFPVDYPADCDKQDLEGIHQWLSTAAENMEKAGLDLRHAQEFEAKCASVFRDMLEYVKARLLNLEVLEYVPDTFHAIGCGNIHDRMLRREVQRRGGTVVGYDHGCGVGRFFSKDVIRMSFFHCDNYVPIDEESRERLIGVSDEHFPDFCKKPREFTAPAGVGYKPWKQLESPVGRKRKVMILPTGVSGQRVRLVVLPPDICDIYLVKDVRDILVDAGYEVTIKPHPAAGGDWKYKWLETEGVSVSSESFEDEMERHDFAVNLCPSSSSSVTSAESGFPMIQVNFPFLEYDFSTFLTFPNVLGAVEGGIDESGRFTVEGDELVAVANRLYS